MTRGGGGSAPGSHPLEGILDAIRGKRVLVAGDYVLDRYLFGRPDRLSREAPVLVLEHAGEALTPGGAGNAARNVRALGGVPIPLGTVGEDRDGESLLEALGAEGIETGGIVRSAARATVAKTRILAGGEHGTKQQILRIDRGDRSPLDVPARARIASAARELAASADALLFSDYGYGTLFAELRDLLVAIARERGIPACADSRFDLRSFAGVTVATPNEEEAAAASGMPAESDAEAALAAGALLERLGSRALLLTRGSRGMLLAEQGKPPLAIPVIGPDEVADVTGAGDTVAGALTLSLAAGASLPDAARIANAAASVVVMKRGAAVASTAEVIRVLARARRGTEGRDVASR